MSVFCMNTKRCLCAVWIGFSVRFMFANSTYCLTAQQNVHPMFARTGFVICLPHVATGKLVKSPNCTWIICECLVRKCLASSTHCELHRVSSAVCNEVIRGKQLLSNVQRLIENEWDCSPYEVYNDYTVKRSAAVERTSM